MKTRFKTLVILGMLTVSSAVKAQDKIIQLALMKHLEIFNNLNNQ